MGKRQQITLAIPKPCSEDWAEMTPNDRGRHCASCDKTVIDFSLYSDRELVDFFKNVTGHVCGRLNNWQANRPMLITEPANRSTFHKWFLGTAFASWLGIVGTGNAQNKKTIVNTVQKDNSSSKDTAKDESLNNTNKFYYIKGLITDVHTHLPIPFATIGIFINDTSLVSAMMSDLDGYFKTNIPTEFANQKLKFLSLCQGYKTYSQIIEIQKSITYIEIKIDSSGETDSIYAATDTGNWKIPFEKPSLIGLIVPEIDNNEWDVNPNYTNPYTTGPSKSFPASEEGEIYQPLPKTNQKRYR